MNNIEKFLKKNIVSQKIIEAKELNPAFNAFSEIFSETKTLNPSGLLTNVPFAIKDNFELQGEITASGSNLLKGHKSLITSTIIQRLLAEGAIAIGKTNLDEYGMGGTGLASCNGYVLNPLNTKRIVGGSSSGSAVAVVLGIVPFALGTDTGDSIRQPASYIGKVGFKPTWGLLSRNGIHAYSPGFDTVGFITNNVLDQATLVSIVSGPDELDFTCSTNKKLNLVSGLNSNIKGQRFCFYKEMKEIFPIEYQKQFMLVVKKLEERGAIIEEISFGPKELMEAIYPTYQSITFAEGYSQLACLDGINFGNIKSIEDGPKDWIAQGRSDGFLDLLKQRILIGSNALHLENKENVFIQAKKIRKIIINRVQEIFQKYDVIINPASLIAPLVEDTKLETDTSVLKFYFLQIANMAGTPSLTLPIGELENMPWSIEVMTNLFEEQLTLNVSLAIEEIMKEGK